MTRIRRERLVRETIRSHGPLTDAQLARWVQRFAMTAGSAKSARERLVAKGQVQFARKLRRVKRGRFAQLWEAVG